MTYQQTLNGENRLVSVTWSGQTTAFTYDGDGRRVKKVDAGGTTYYVGSYYELKGSTVTTYYYLGGQRVAMKVGSTVYYLHGDHLGSTSLSTSTSQAVVAQRRYYPYGEFRWVNSTLPTDYTFTGQRHDGYIKLIQMGARWYSEKLGRWISADTIVPDLASPQSFNRYSYVRNNVLRYTDPTGHIEAGEEQDALDIIRDLALYGVSIGVDFGWQLVPTLHPSPDDSIEGKDWMKGAWTLSELSHVQRAVHDFAGKMTEGTTADPAQKFSETVGKVNIQRIHGKDLTYRALEAIGIQSTAVSHFGTVKLYDGAFNQTEVELWGTIVHEIAHAWDWNSGGIASLTIGSFVGNEQRPSDYAADNPLRVEWWPEVAAKWVYSGYAGDQKLGIRQQQFAELMVDVAYPICLGRR